MSVAYMAWPAQQEATRSLALQSYRSGGCTRAGRSVASRPCAARCIHTCHHAVCTHRPCSTGIHSQPSSSHTHRQAAARCEFCLLLNLRPVTRRLSIWPQASLGSVSWPHPLTSISGSKTLIDISQQEFCRIRLPMPAAAEFLFCRFAKIRRGAGTGVGAGAWNPRAHGAMTGTYHTPLMHWAKHTSPGPEWRSHSSTSRART